MPRPGRAVLATVFFGLVLLHSNEVVQNLPKIRFEFGPVLSTTERGNSREGGRTNHHHVKGIGAFQDRVNRIRPGCEGATWALATASLVSATVFAKSAAETFLRRGMRKGLEPLMRPAPACARR